MKIKYNAPYRLEQISKGEFIDLQVCETYHIDAPSVVEDTTKKKSDIIFPAYSLDLGIAMQLPKDFEAIMVPRSSTFSKYKILLDNSVGVIDSSYCGDNDRWRFNCVAFGESIVTKYSRICQFTIRPSMKASIWTKLKWLFTNKVEFEYVDVLGNPNRGGFGSTGV